MTATLDLDRFTAILETQFGTAKSLAELRALLATPWQRELLWRAALPIRFDEKTLQQVLLHGIEGATPEEMRDWLENHRGFERDASQPPTFGMHDSVRTETTVAPLQHAATKASVGRLRAFSGLLARHFLRRGPEWDLDALSVMALSEPQEATRRASRLFSKAERKADFTHAYQVLSTLEERLPQVRSLAGGSHAWAKHYAAIVRSIEGFRRRYDAGRSFAGDFERTVHVLERKSMLSQWRWLTRKTRKSRKKSGTQRTSREKWILNIEARGGSGKSMFLRWLSARKCARHGVPYARLDFDFVDPRLTTVPWYLLGQCARILDAQLSDRPLRPVINRVDDAAPYDAFTASPADAARTLSRLRSETGTEVGTSILNDIAAALNASKAPAVIIVLDTVEVALLHPDADVIGLLRELQKLHAACSKLRIILSGRFDLANKLTDFDEEFGESVRPWELDQLTQDESKDYLVEQRGLPRGSLVNAIAHKCGGFPFTLSMFADEWQVNPNLSATEVRNTPGPDLYYLVRRVLQRVPPIIAWLVRYGVVAEHLTKTFLAEVIVPELNELRRSSRYDNPVRDAKNVAQYFKKAKLELGTEEFDPDALWNALDKHAAAFSFVSKETRSSEDGAVRKDRSERFVFHEEVRRPMRSVLSKQPVYRRLHRRAMEVGLSRAGELTAGREAEWEAEIHTALYHALRYSPAAAQRIWNEARNAAVRHGAFSEAAMLAPAILDASVDVSPALRLDAARVRTQSLISKGVGRRNDPKLWDDARTARTEWLRILRATQSKADAAYYIAGARIAARTGFTSTKQLRALERLLDRTRTPSAQLELHVALAEGHLSPDMRLQHVEAGLAILRRKGHGWNPTHVQRFKLSACQELVRHGDYTSALKTAREISRACRHLSLTERVENYAALIHLLTMCDELAQVSDVIRDATALDKFIVVDGIVRDKHAFHARLRLRWNAILACAYGATAAPPALTATGPDDTSALAQEEISQASEHLERLRVGEALTSLQEARNRAGTSHPELAAVALSHAAQATHFILGDARRARDLMTDAASLSLAEGSFEWWLVNFTLVALRTRTSSRAIRRIGQYRTTTPHVFEHLATLVAALESPKDRRRAARALPRALVRVRPLAAARRLLASFLYGPSTTLPADETGHLSRVLQITRRYTQRQRERDPGHAVERLKLCRFAQAPHIPSAGIWLADDCLPLAKWTIASAGLDPSPRFDDGLLNDDSVSPFARGIAHFACASAVANEQPERAQALLQQARELLSALDTPSVWQARVDLLQFELDLRAGRENEATLLAVEESCERLDAPEELKRARDLRKSRSDDEEKKPDVAVLEFNDARSLSSGKYPLLQAAGADAESMGSQRMPEEVVKQLTTRFASSIRDLQEFLPVYRRTRRNRSQGSFRQAIVSDAPSIAALPLELAIARRNRSTPRFGEVLEPGWRSTESPRDFANERWALRVFHHLGITGTISDGPALTREFQQSRRLPVTGRLDTRTLRAMVYAARGNRGPTVGFIVGGSASHPNDKIIPPVTRIYGLHGAIPGVDSPTTKFVVQTDARKAIAALTDTFVDVVHIAATLVESTSFGGLAFDLRGRDDLNTEVERAYLPVSAIARAIKRPQALVRPIVVVHNSLADLPTYETIRQFALRNIVAMELFKSTGPVSTVGVSSSWDGSDGWELPMLLGRVLASGHPLSRFLESLKRPVPTSRYLVSDAATMASELQTYSPCVFANNPDYVVI